MDDIETADKKYCAYAQCNDGLIIFRFIDNQSLLFAFKNRILPTETSSS